MNVEDLFQQLSYGPLSNLAMAVEATGTIEPTAQPRVLVHANQGLKHLYSRFLLSEQSVMVTLQEGVSEYELPVNDLLRIQAVYTAFGVSLPLADAAHPAGIAVLGSRLNIPLVHEDFETFAPGTELEVVYQGKHPLLLSENAGLTPAQVYAQEILLPEVLEKALTAFIASEIYGGMNTPDATAASQTHRIHYETVCDEAVRYGLLSTGQLSTATRFENNGWA